ncbi:MAG TPA: baseplate J/gp47 family protein [Anaerolineales bacterium]
MMKTQVIKLDSHDDVISVRDKMSWAKTERILLVFPRRSRILARTLDLRLLQRHAAMLGAQLAIVSRSDDLRRTAEELHIPAFATVASAPRKVLEREKSPTRPTRRFVRSDLRQMRRAALPPEARWRSLLGFRFLFFTLAVLAILAVLSLFIPSATIQLSPETRLQSLTFTISASRNVTTVNLAGSLPARLTSVVVENSKTVKATGLVTIPDARSQGLARFRNLTTTLTGIPAGTVVSTQTSPPVRFATTKDAVVAAGIDKTVNVPVQAVEAGSSGNLPANTLIVFEGDLGTSLAVTNPSPTGGGSDRTAAIQTAADRSLVHEALLAELLEECKTSLEQTLIPGDIFFPDTLVVSQVLTETYFPAEGQSGDTLSLTMRLQCQAHYASLADVNALVEMSLNANLPEGFTPASGGLAILPASTPRTDAEGITRWDVKAQRSLHARLDPLTAVQLSLGRKPAEIILLLSESLPLAKLPIIQVKPDWWPWLPVVPFRITVSTGN